MCKATSVIKLLASPAMPWPKFTEDRQTYRQGFDVFLVYNPAVEMKPVAACAELAAPGHFQK